MAIVCHGDMAFWIWMVLGESGWKAVKKLVPLCFDFQNGNDTIWLRYNLCHKNLPSFTFSSSKQKQ